MEMFDLTAYREMRAQDWPAHLALKCASNVARLTQAVVPLKRDTETHLTLGTRVDDEIDFFCR